MVSAEDLERMAFPKDKAILRIKNPLSQEQEVLRPTALVGLLGAIRHNLNRKEKDLAFFEVSRRFYQGHEEEVLALAVTGEWMRNWAARQDAGFFYLKGLVENIFKAAGRKMPEWKEAEVWPGTFNQTLVLEGPMGFRMTHVGRVSDEALKGWDILQPVFAAEILLDDLLKMPRVARKFAELPKFPSARRDIAFLINRDISIGQIESALRTAAGERLTRVQLFDLYEGKNIPKDKRSLAFSLQYQKPDGTFTDDEIQGLHASAVEGLRQAFSIELRQ
jgi:phenylalanyl-tRNA synthetase beta chain